MIYRISKGVVSIRQEAAIASLFFCKLESWQGLWSWSDPKVPDSVAHTPYAIQACLLTDRTAYKYHLFTFPHYLSRGFSLQNWSPRSTQYPQAHTVVLMSCKQIPEIGLEGSKSNLLFFRPIFEKLQWPFTAFPGCILLVSRPWHLSCTVYELQA